MLLFIQHIQPKQHSKIHKYSPSKDNAKAKRFFKFTKNTLKNIVIGYSSLILCEVRKYLKNNGYVLLKYELKFWINNNHKISNQNIAQ